MIKSHYGRLYASWLEMSARPVDDGLKWYQANVSNYVDQIDPFALALQHYAERKVMLVFGISLAGRIGIFTLVFPTLRRTRQQVVHPLNKLVMASQQIKHGQSDIPPLDTGLSNELGLLDKTFSQMSSELHKLYRLLEASVAEKAHDLREASHRLEVLYQCPQTLSTSRIDVHCFRHTLRTAREHDTAYLLKLTIGDNWWTSKGTRSPEPPMQILPITMQETVYGELHRQGPNVSASTSLLNSVSSILGRGLYFNQAREHFQQLLLMEGRATIVCKLHDSPTRVLFYLRIQLMLLKRSIPEDSAPVQSIMTDFSQVLSDVYRQLRELLTTFRLTLQWADLPPALHEILETLQNQISAKLALDCRLLTLALDVQVQVHLLQIIREAVLNAIEHASANEITVSCVTTPDGNHTVYIRDSGTGIGKPHEPIGHYGFNITREWAERLSDTLIFSQSPGRGALVSISFRLAKSDSELI